mmetsp:Transcript_22793/g.54185  ORF Transcript_22793/g.54185 Transcript_22793/m.54185 type:complete len:212 (+) Transcript_22793:250-885(+)
MRLRQAPQRKLGVWSFPGGSVPGRLCWETLLEADSLRCSTIGPPGGAPGGPTLAAPAAICCSSPIRCRWYSAYSLFVLACRLRPPACKPSMGVGSGADSRAALDEPAWPPCSVSWPRDKPHVGDGEGKLKVPAASELVTASASGWLDAENAAESSGPSKVSTKVCRSTSRWSCSPSRARGFGGESLGTLKSFGSGRRPCQLENERGIRHVD